MDTVRRLAGGLTAAGFGAGQTVALMAPNCPEFCVVFHAVAFAGGTITTINPTYTAPEVTHQLNDAGASLLITIPALADSASGGFGLARGSGMSRPAATGSISFGTSMTNWPLWRMRPAIAPGLSPEPK